MDPITLSAGAVAAAITGAAALFNKLDRTLAHEFPELAVDSRRPLGSTLAKTNSLSPTARTDSGRDVSAQALFNQAV